MTLEALLLVALAGGPDLEPEQAQLRQAEKLAASLRSAGGAERALKALCSGEASGPSYEAAFTVLVERAEAAMPKLLDAVVAGHAPDAAEHDTVWRCADEAPKVAAAAVCVGRAPDLYQLDRRPNAAIQRGRAAAQRALVASLGKAGPRQGAALEVLSFARLGARGCDAGADLVGVATPALLKLLAVNEHEGEALVILASGGGDPAIAVAPLRRYLGDKAALPFAALAFARMGQDVSEHVGALSELLDGPNTDIVLQALEAIGPKAHVALPRLVALSKRPDTTCDRPAAARRVQAARAISAGVEDGPALVSMLTPLLACPTTSFDAAKGLVLFGATDVLLKFLRSEQNPAQNRLDVATVLRQSGVTLEASDQALVRALEARLGPPPTSQVP
jgi:hypothetical protein